MTCARWLGALALAAVLPAPRVLTAQGPAPDPAPVWRADPAHSRVGFRVRHLGLSWVNGEFGEWTAELHWDPDRPEEARVTVRIAAAGVNTGQARRDDDLRRNYLVVDSFPEITFRSRAVERIGDGRFRMAGDLTIRGTTRPVVLDVEGGAVLATPRERRAAFQAATTIRRQDFGITRNFLIEGAQVVGDEVRILVDLEVVAAPGGASAPGGA